MYKNILYPTKNIYLGTIEFIDEDNPVDQIVAFIQKKDNLSSEAKYISLNNKIGYYYIKQLDPIKKHMSLNEKKNLLTLAQIERIVARENKKEKVSHLVETKQERKVVEKPDNKEKEEYKVIEKVEEPIQKTIKYRASHSRKAA